MLEILVTSTIIMFILFILSIYKQNQLKKDLNFQDKRLETKNEHIEILINEKTLLLTEKAALDRKITELIKEINTLKNKPNKTRKR